MAKIQFLTILLVVTCLLGSVVSVTNMESEVRTACIELTMVKIQFMAILLTFFLDGVVFVTDKELQVGDAFLKSQDLILSPFVQNTAH